jgi:hypothetical protein
MSEEGFLRHVMLGGEALLVAIKPSPKIVRRKEEGVGLGGRIEVEEKAEPVRHAGVDQFTPEFLVPFEVAILAGQPKFFS